MRKRKLAFKNLDLYTTYEVRGLNLDRLLNTLVNKGVDIAYAKKVGNKRLIIKVKFYENEKVFAIIKDLCYTDIRKIKDGGKAYPLLFFLRNLGLVIGGAIFIALSAFFNDVILDLEYTGSGKVLEREITAYLSSVGVKEYGRFSSIDLAALSDGILKDNPRLSFAECTKKGNRLNINLALAHTTDRVIEGNKSELVSEYDGEIVGIKVYRGNPLVSVGDTVKKGDLLVSGRVTVKDTPVDIGVIAFVTIRVSSEYTYISNNDGEENFALLFAENALGESEEAVVYKSQGENGEYIYKVTLYYERVIFTG